MKIKDKIKKFRLSTVFSILFLTLAIMVSFDTKIYADPTGMNLVNNTVNNTVTQKSVGTKFSYSQIPVAGNPMDNKLKKSFKNIWASLVTILQIAAVAGIVFAGVRYMFASAEAKADIKSSMIHLIIGMAIVFAASTLIKVIITVFNEVT